MTAEPDRTRQSRYEHLTHDELVRLLEVRDRHDATRFGLVWEANEIERDEAVNSDFVACEILLYGSSPCAVTDFEQAVTLGSPVVWP